MVDLRESRMLKFIVTVILALSDSAATAEEQEFPSLAYFGDWSVFSDGEVCWIGSFSVDPFLEEQGPRMTVTLFDHNYDGDFAVFDPARYGDAELIVLEIGGSAFPLDQDPADPEYAFNNTRGLLRAIEISEETAVEIKFANSKKQINSYKFSLVGYDDAIDAARDFCHESI
jgi:hypothetical protein